MANQLRGKVIAISDIETIPSKDAQKQPIQKRKLLIDCTRFDPITGERGFENTPMLEFGGKTLEKLNELVANGLKKDDIVTVTFDVQGTMYTNKQGKKDVFTRIRPYNIEVEGNQVQQETHTPVYEQATSTAQAKQESELPF